VGGGGGGGGGGAERREAAAGGDSPEWLTCALEFDRSEGWDRARAEGWVEERLRLRDLGRTAFLAVPHRFTADLARVLSDLVFEGAFHCGELARSPGGPALELVAVPPLEDRGGPPRP